MKKQSILVLPLVLSGCVPLAVGGVAVVGTTATEERGLEGFTEDKLIKTRISNNWTSSKYNLSDLELTVYKGKVLMTGFVKDAQAKEDAIKLARQVKGVVNIIDGIEIGPGQDLQTYSRDSWITTKIKSSLYFVPNVQAPNYVIHTFNHKVYIFGTAQTKDEAKSVIETASNTAGVRQVKNLIEIKAKPTPVPPSSGKVSPHAKGG